MPNTGANDTYASMMPDLGDNANIQEAIKKYHYGNQDPTILNEVAFSSDFADPTDGIVGKLKWIKTQIDAIQAAGASGGIFNSIIDAKGDLIVGTGADTPAKFSVGANGTFLKVDTSVGSTSLRWASLDETHLNLNPSSQSLVGNLTIAKANAALILAASSGTSYLQVQSISGQNKGLQLQTGSSNRWELLSNSTSESSTATGSDLVLNRYDNSGSLLGTVLTITRSSGLATFANNVTITGTLNASTISSGTWNGSIISGQYGGTGVANTGKTIAVSGNTSIGSSTHTVSFATSGNTSVTLPTNGTLAITGSGLNQFASTTSSQLAGVISDETGSGSLVFSGSPTFTGNVTVPDPSVGTAAANKNYVDFVAGYKPTLTYNLGTKIYHRSYVTTLGNWLYGLLYTSIPLPTTAGASHVVITATNGDNTAGLPKGTSLNVISVNDTYTSADILWSYPWGASNPSGAVAGAAVRINYTVTYI